MSKTIEVQFLSQLPDEKGEVYSGTKLFTKTYIRQPMPDGKRVTWLVATKWDGKIEAGTPLPAGTTIKVVVPAKKETVTLFSETIEADGSGVLSANKEEFFSFEQIQNAVRHYCKDMSLHTQEQWTKWLQRDAPQFNYTGYPDNWLHFGTALTQAETIGSLDIIGIPYTVTSTVWKHMVSSKTWNVIEIKDANEATVALCGYEYTSK